MLRVDMRLHTFLPFIFGLLLVSSACNQAPTETPLVEKTVLITQILTEVVYTATPEPTLTSHPTSTPTPLPTSTPTFNPYSAPIYYPLKDCVASRLHVGDIAMVSPGGGPNGIRYGMDLYYDTIVAYADPGTELNIVGGPFCSHGWIVWLVQTKNGIIGYTPEGNGDEYWLLPTK
jgi:hypothetical protein